ncbi:hypothetical protein NHX12_021898 [Muraenolepis orangiensis]|uniref:Bcl-2 Bcl-2 homology region 1-3 domain-containing protein n=1 Tax=Muraenolepis orangiensis TaxID=630683 RepID=A0A9Q0EUE1_9TELE|nr:hypothetical protein NHX12_021898 [Muraenolepis orangiensis]
MDMRCTAPCSLLPGHLGAPLDLVPWFPPPMSVTEEKDQIQEEEEDSRSSLSQEEEEDNSPVAPLCQQYGVRSRVPTSGSRLQSVLQRAGAELDQIHQQDFLSQVSGHFVHLTPGGVRASLRAIGGELFADGVNWGRVVAMMEFGAAMCAESAARRTSWTADDVAAWLVESLDGPLLRGWTHDNGGWGAPETWVRFPGCSFKSGRKMELMQG